MCSSELVQSNAFGASGQFRQDPLGLCVKPAPARHFDLFNSSKSKRPRNGAGPLDVFIDKFALRPGLHPTDDEENDPHPCALISGCAVGVVRGPDLLEIVELTDLGTEQMHDNVPGVDQHPVSIGHTFDTGRASGQLLDVLCEMICQSRDVTTRTA